MKDKISNLLKNIEKQHGKGSLRFITDTSIDSIETISSGSISLDIALGGGYPKGRIIEIYGAESSGKTTLALHSMAEALKSSEHPVAFIDAEHSLDPLYAESLGVDLSRLLISQPDSGEQALEILDSLVGDDYTSVVVVDSVSALTPRAEIEGEMGESKMGLQARLMSQALRKIAGRVSKSDTIVIFINQLRQKIGVMFGNPETTSGGNALKFYASVRLDVRRIGINKSTDGEAISNRVRVKVVKNKVAPPFKKAEFTIKYGTGVSTIEETLDISVELGFVIKSGSWYSCEGVKLGQGKESATLTILENPDLLEELDYKIRAKLGIIEIS